MSDELSTRPPDAIAPAKAAANPMRLVPKEWREAVGFFWLLNQHLLPAPTPLAARMRVYQADGLTLDELRAVLRSLSAPSRQQNHRFAADLLTDLALEVSRVLAERKAAERFAAECEAARGLPLPHTSAEFRADWRAWCDAQVAAGNRAELSRAAEKLAYLARVPDGYACHLLLDSINAGTGRIRVADPTLRREWEAAQKGGAA